MLSQIPLTPGMDQATMATTVNQNFEQIAAENRSKVVRDESGTDRIIFGRYPDGNYGLKVSKPGVDVSTAEDNDLIFNSSNNLFKIVDSGTVPMTLPDIPNGTKADVSQTVAHNLGYSPLVIAFITQTNPQSPAVETRLFGASSVQAKSVSTAGVVISYVSDEKVIASATNVTFNWSVSNAAGYAQQAQTATIKYYLLSETAV